jgi:hypothetical protein
MAERRPILRTSGVEIGFIEDSTAFDLFDRPRCSYDVVTGNLSDSTTGKLVGYVSSEKNFVVPSRIAAELFGQPRKADAELSLIAGLPTPSSSEDNEPTAAGGSVAAATNTGEGSDDRPKASIDSFDNPPDPTESSVEEILSVEEDLMERAMRLIRSGLEKRPL